MKLSGKIAVRFGLLGIAVAVLSVLVCALCVDEEPALITPAQDARKVAVSFLESVCAGNYEQAGKKLSGTPSMGADRVPDSDVGKLIWDAFVNSLSYDLISECYASGSGVAVDVRLTCLDIDGVAAAMKERTQDNIALRVESAEDIDEIYDDNYEYREEFIMDVVQSTVEQILQEDGNTRTVSFTMHLVYEDETWWVVPDETLLRAVSGGILN